MLYRIPYRGYRYNCSTYAARRGARNQIPSKSHTHSCLVTARSALRLVLTQCWCPRDVGRRVLSILSILSISFRHYSYVCGGLFSLVRPGLRVTKRNFNVGRPGAPSSARPFLDSMPTIAATLIGALAANAFALFQSHPRCNTGCGEAPALFYIVHTPRYPDDVCFGCDGAVSGRCAERKSEVSEAISSAEGIGWWEAAPGSTSKCTGGICSCCFAYHCDVMTSAPPPPSPQPPQLQRAEGRGRDLHVWGADDLAAAYSEPYAMKLQTLQSITYSEDPERRLLDFLCGCYVPECTDDSQIDHFFGRRDTRCHDCGDCSWDTIDGFSWAIFEGTSEGYLGSNPKNRGLVLHDHVSDTTIVAFRGTVHHDSEGWVLGNLLQDVHFQRGPITHRDSPQVHLGFKSAFHNVFDGSNIATLACRDHSGSTDRCRAASMRDFLHVYHNAESKLMITGHSLGGAMATVAAYTFATTEQWPVSTLVTFGSPRVGGASFGTELLRLVPGSWRVTRRNDGVPWLPPKELDRSYVHVPNEIFYEGERQPFSRCADGIDHEAMDSCSYGTGKGLAYFVTGEKKIMNFVVATVQRYISQGTLSCHQDLHHLDVPPAKCLTPLDIHTKSDYYIQPAFEGCDDTCSVTNQDGVLLARDNICEDSGLGAGWWGPPSNPQRFPYNCPVGTDCSDCGWSARYFPPVDVGASTTLPAVLPLRPSSVVPLRPSSVPLPPSSVPLPPSSVPLPPSSPIHQSELNFAIPAVIILALAAISLLVCRLRYSCCQSVDAIPGTSIPVAQSTTALEGAELIEGTTATTLEGTVAVSELNPAAKIALLKQMMDDGLINQDNFDKKRDQILQEGRGCTGLNNGDV